MPGTLQPLDEKFAIVDSNGRPTLYFIQWAQQKQIDISEGITGAQANEIFTAYLLAHQLQEGSGIQITPSGNISDSPTIAADVQEILDQITSTRGAMLYRGLLGWAALLPGSSGQFLKTLGAGADPAWATVSSSGGDTLIADIPANGVTTVFTFSSIAAIYKGLRVECWFTTPASAAFTAKCNNDASALYGMQRSGHENGLINLQQLTQTSWNPTAAVFNSGVGIDFSMLFGNYASANKKFARMHLAAGTTGSGNLAAAIVTLLYDSATAVNRLDFTWSAAPTAGQIRLFGVN